MSHEISFTVLLKEYWGYIGILEKKMEITIEGVGLHV